MAAIDLDYPRALLLVLGVAIVLTVAVVGSTSGTAFGTFNPAWDGTSELRSIADDADTTTDVIRNSTVYEAVEANRTLAVILSPEESYGEQDLARVANFVRRGGTLLVAEDVGIHGNTVLEGVGASARFDGGPLRDERDYHRAPALPIADITSTHTLTTDVDQLTLNHGTAVQPGAATVLATTSSYSYIDANRDETLDDEENMRSYPVLTVESVGDGQVIAMGDPSVFINAMLERPGNRAFAETLLGTHDRLLQDYSHAGELPPLTLAVLILRDSPLLQFLLGLSGLAVIGLVARDAVPARLQTTRDRDTPQDLDRADLRAYLESQHPDWDEERVERVIRGLMSRRGQGGGDE